MRRTTLAILGFHNIGPAPRDWPSWFYVSEERLVAQLECLRRNNWQVLGVEDLIRGLNDPAAFPERAALLTFDDGYRSILNRAVPVLQQFGFPAVLFVPTDFIGGENTFDCGVEPQEPICSWAELRELMRLGVSVQSHGVSHRRFSGLTRSEQEAELMASKRHLERELDLPVELFAFPYGDAGREHSSTGTVLDRAGYKAAFTYPGGPVRLPVADRYRIERVAMGPDTELTEILERACS